MEGIKIGIQLDQATERSSTKQFRRQGKTIVVGRPHDVPRALEHPLVAAAGGLEAAGVLVIDEEVDNRTSQGASLDALLREAGATTIFVAGPLGKDAMRIVTDIALLNGCRVIAVMPSEFISEHDPRIVWEGERPLIQLLGSRHTTFQFALKRGIDAVGAAAGLVLLSPLFAIIALLVKLDSTGPVIFRHTRLGKGARTFACLKFRTMVEDAELRLASDGALLASYFQNNFRVPDATDPRVTKLGRILRRTSLDELPQLWNVLVGEMSLIGPRPVVPNELQHFSGSERLLLSVRPGMTGMWAVTGRHGCAYPERAELELRYVRSWSLVGDVSIALRTVSAIANYGSQPSNSP